MPWPHVVEGCAASRGAGPMGSDQLHKRNVAQGRRGTCGEEARELPVAPQGPAQGLLLAELTTVSFKT